MSKDFEQISLKSGFMKHNGGVLFKTISEKEYQFKTTITENHLNAAGITHGGFIAALIDSGAGTAAHRVSDQNPCVTISLDLKFISAVKLGQELIGNVKIQKKTKSMVFLTCELKVKDKIAATASGILVESSKGDPYETAQWRKIFQEEYDKGRDVEPQYMKFVTKKEEPKKVVNDLLTVTWPEETETNNELKDREKQLNELILKAAMEKIHEATSGIGKFQFDRMRANSGGPADKPPTLEDYLRLGLSLAILTDDERRVVQELWKNTMETKNEK